MGWIEGTVISKLNSQGVYNVEVGTDSVEVKGEDLLPRNSTLNEDLLDDLTNLSIMNEASGIIAVQVLFV